MSHAVSTASNRAKLCDGIAEIINTFGLDGELFFLVPLNFDDEFHQVLTLIGLVVRRSDLL